MPAALAPKVKNRKPSAGPQLDAEVAEILSDALDPRNKSADTYNEDIVEAHTHAHRHTNTHRRAVRSHTPSSSRSSPPTRPQVLANRSLALLSLKRGPEALQDAALCVTLKKNFAKGRALAHCAPARAARAREQRRAAAGRYYRFGCALEECKMYKECASARNLLEMVMNVERVSDPLWMHKPEPPKSEVQKRAEDAQAEHEREMSHLREEIGKASFDYEYLHAPMSKSDRWYEESMMAKGLNMHLLAHSAELARLMDAAHVDSFAEAIREHVPRMAGVVLLLGGTMGLLPLLALEAGANQAHGFCAKMAHASVGRHTLLAFERENWSRLPMTLGLAERTRQAGSAAFKMGQFDQAAQALQALGRNGEARDALAGVIQRSRGGKNADAERLLSELEGLPARGPALPGARAGGGGGAGGGGAGGGGAGGGGGRPPAREDRAQRLTVKEVRALHRPFDELRLHHELEHKPDLLLLTNFDYTLLGSGIVTALNSLKAEELLRPGTAVLPPAARVWAMAVQVLADTGVPIDSSPAEKLLWSPTLRRVCLDEPHARRTLRPLTRPAVVCGFDFRATAPPIKPDKCALELSVVEDGRANAVVFWFEMPLGAGGVVSSAPLAALPAGAAQLGLGQALQYLEPAPVREGGRLLLHASHSRTRFLFSHAEPAETRVRRGATLPLLAAHNSLEMMFTIEEDKLTRKGADCELLPHTRFDPRWEGARVNLDDQWKKIIQGLAAAPKDSASLQEGVMRFAAQSAAFGIDTGVAERCALTFLSD
ncbi:hypothetical protein EMIHUDRAFT_119940 [Emiliania huxleyi CCMP1516]|uniref:Uncharacterized protein n=2 Tax=Emiliania huxleyi TaxID=2903 RepID=A0A0D3IPP7_EMIH1|nr:hypothetical protein EMIHUDRAFT_119940 [Emiliania huxleyi CCMP1516]EOD13232.1 hypothetical protein EMIHUDRAFT_119940 [Emiliania huxleyi CCMP1516]|eukprot:XP_005765661.1 hypothetical protein EMIHUDRAFT_119940 [Emiliania huxleyi CCMP1516]